MLTIDKIPLRKIDALRSLVRLFVQKDGTRGLPVKAKACRYTFSVLCVDNYFMAVYITCLSAVKLHTFAVFTGYIAAKK